ncbi:RNA polymerase sigma factor [Membranihabitans maritimus]|uniref:RNA polymerase sigma factor n=1 Tax=Membranihabitans maritimus TaxID=2904244 RepID=UPI001F02047B|nr:RNA polymerase sigma-70 factor [Membranihabitans maritimus]
MDSIENILKVYEKRIYAFFLKNIKLPSVAEDLTQDVLIKLWIRRKNLGNIQNIDSFVFTIAKNHVIDHLRKAKSDQLYKEALVHQIKTQEPKALDNIIYKDYKNILDGLLNDLPPRQREIFQLSRIKGLSHDEIAEQLNISNKTVRNHLFEALKYLKTQINLDTMSLIGIIILNTA